MFEPLPKEWVDLIAGWATTKSEIIAIYVFGSRAKGLSRQDSDLDLAIVTSGDHQQRLIFSMFEGSAWKTHFDGALPVKVDFQFADPDGDTVVWPSVQDHGVLIYGAELR